MNGIKKIDWDKVWKTIGIIAVIAAVIWFFESRSQRAYKEKEKVKSAIWSLSEDLHELSVYAEDSSSYGYEDMRVSLYYLQEECQKLSGQAEDLYKSDFFRDQEPEENTRSWWY